MSKEGGLGAPTRHPIPWNDAAFYDAGKLDVELRRVFDICHGCRRCFNLCDSFPLLFDLIDDSESGELDTVKSADFKPVIDACTLCDMCFMTKCPYVPPHEFDLDFPHLMLRARAIETKNDGIGFFDKQLTETDRNGKLGCSLPGLTNWASKCGNLLTRPLLESVAGVHRDAHLPEYSNQSLVDQAKATPVTINTDAPAHGRKAIIYATCFSNYNAPAIGLAARNVLAHNGINAEVVHPGCCGMPQLEHGDIARVAEQAKVIAAAYKPWIEQGYEIISLVPSCTLMLKFEWPLILPDDEDVRALALATSDISEYMVDIARNEGLADGLGALDGSVTVHIACHARAQNMGRKAADMLNLIPDTQINVIERCSGHGGSWGIMKENFETGLKVGKPVAQQAAKSADHYIVSECPLARDHILQGMDRLEGAAPETTNDKHPIELLAAAYSL